MIESWPEDDRPRERLYSNGPGALADAELLALQLGSGVRGRSAVDVARDVLATYGSLAEIASREVAELAEIRGIGPVKAARLVAAFELTRRLRARTPGQRVILSGPEEVYAAFGPLMEDLKREVFKPAILESAASVILLHNHPSGDPTPSREDVRLTRQLADCARLLDLRIHDHVIIGRGRFVSFAQKGIL